MKLQELRRKIYIAAKSDKRKRFWGMYCHVIKEETLYEAYIMTKQNNGSAGIDGVTFKDIEERGVKEFIAEIKQELEDGTYRPQRNRRQEIPKSNGKVRVLGIPTIKDRVVQGALKLILEAVFEADFADNSYGYRPKRNQHDAVVRVAKAPLRRLTKVIDVDLTSYFDNIKHHILLQQIARRKNDPKIMWLVKLILKANGKVGVPQGGVISPLFSNIYLNRIDHMFETAVRETEHNGYQQIEYCRFADDMVILVNGHKALKWLVSKAWRRLREELSRLKVKINETKSCTVDLQEGETFNFLGFTFRLTDNKNGRNMVLIRPRKKKVKEIMDKVRNCLKRSGDKPKEMVIWDLNEIIRGWVDYYRIGHCGRLFSFLKDWIEKKVRRFVRRRQGRKGFGWKEWSKEVIYDKWGLYSDYQVRYYNPKVKPA